MVSRTHAQQSRHSHTGSPYAQVIPLRRRPIKLPATEKYIRFADISAISTSA